MERAREDFQVWAWREGPSSACWRTGPWWLTYRMAAVSYLVARLLVRVPYFSLPNLLAGRRLVPEFLQGEVRAGCLGPELSREVLRYAAWRERRGESGPRTPPRRHNGRRAISVHPGRRDRVWVGRPAHGRLGVEVIFATRAR